MAAPMEKTRHAGIYKRGSRYVAVWQDVRGLLSRGPPAIRIAERVRPTGQGA